MQSSPTIGLELARAVEHRAVLHRRARADHDAALVAAQHRLRPDRRRPAPITTLPMIVASGCTKASGSICGTMSPRAYSAMDADSSLPGDGPVDARTTCKEVAEQGYTIVEDAIEPELVDALNDDLDAARAVLRGRARRRTRSRATTRCASTTCSRSTASVERVPVHQHVLPIVEGVLDPGCLISSLSSIAILPGETAQPIHADDQLIPIPKPHPPTVCNSMWALTDFTEANGATRIIPGSHLADHSPDYGADYDSIAAEMPKGSVLIWHGSLWHGGGANTHRRDAHRHRDELLRGLHPPAGEPAARHPARDGRRRSRRACASSSATASTTCSSATSTSSRPSSSCSSERRRAQGESDGLGRDLNVACWIDDRRRRARAHAQPSRRAERVQRRAVPRVRGARSTRPRRATTSRASCSPAPAARSPRARTSARWADSTRRAARTTSATPGPGFPHFLDTLAAFEKPLIAAVNGSASASA